MVSYETSRRYITVRTIKKVFLFSKLADKLNLAQLMLPTYE